ncbi:hypothetical protein WOLCODRAFT_89710 [Wolfiporia cocos MD-104 SS10]|uniref:Ser-Thr-rich glycosyl-phosphatidyl-inositol-anchored membrane family-domain-containing protein n=1 Tax=Wolfiporia cocos (strain MD-104) TaxID=742152 RepID=A0A2H3JL49_WOLCO|nr:hypothetical protein WOLCODRAFT_89710 [Wolfiporia cocos MD-104 SS10]
MVSCCAVLTATIISTTGITECEPVLISWSGGTAPYYLSLVPGTNTGAAPIKNFGEQQSTQYTWNVDVPAGTQFTTVIKDSTGAVAMSDSQTVQSGPDSSCVNSSVSESSSSTATAPAASQSGASSASGSSTAASTTDTSSASASAHSSGSASSSGVDTAKSSATNSASTASSTGASSSGAGRVTSASALGVAAVMGLVGAALL